MNNQFSQPVFLVCRPDRLGDTVLALPLITGIKIAFPQSKVVVLVRRYSEPLLRHHKDIDQILLLDDDQPFIKKVKQIRSFKIDFAFSLLPNKKVNALLFLSGIKNRFGVGHKFYQFLVNVKNVYRNKYTTLRHEADYCFDFLRKAAPGKTDRLPPAKIYLTDEEQRQVTMFREKYKDYKLIGLQVKSGGSAPNMPPEEYLNLYKKAGEIPRFKVFILDEKQPFISNEVFDDNLLINKGLDLRAALVHYAVMDVLITSSTGPLHICSALGVKSIGLYCPLPACTPELWGTRGAETVYLLPEKEYCSVNCPGDPKVCTFSGSGGIDADKILNTLNSIFPTVEP